MPEEGTGIQVSRARELQGDYSTPCRHAPSVEELLRKLASRGVVFEEEVEEVVEEEDVQELEQA